MENKIDILQVHHKIMNTLKLTPKDGKIFTAFNKAIIALTLSPISILWYGTSYHLIINIQRNKITLGEIIDDVTDLAAVFGCSLIVAFGTRNNKRSSDLLISLREFSKFGKPPQVEKLNRKLNIFTAFYMCYTFIGTLIYYVYKIIFDKTCEENNIKYNKSDMCGCIVATSFPFNLERPFDNIFRFIQTSFVAYNAALMAVFIAYTICCSEFIIVRISHLKTLLQNVFADNDCVKSKEGLHFCVEYHNHIISLVDKYNEIFMGYYILYFTFNGPVLSIIGFRFILEPNVSVIIHALGWTVGIFMTCVVGQRLIDESKSVADAAYNSGWYEADISSQIIIKMIILRAQKPLHQKVWEFTESSHITFGKIIKTSYSALAVLNGIYN